MESCPKDLYPYDKAHELQLKEQDELQHIWWGNYGISALIVAIDSCLNGKSAKSEYIKSPIMAKMFEEEYIAEKETEDQEIKKAIEIEKQWMARSMNKGLPETII